MQKMISLGLGFLLMALIYGVLWIFTQSVWLGWGLIALAVLALYIDASNEFPFLKGLGLATTVPQAERYTTKIFGKFFRILKPGFNWIIPGIERVDLKISIADQLTPIHMPDTVTEDNIKMDVQATVIWDVMDDDESIKKAAYEINPGSADNTTAIETTTKAKLRSIFGSHEREYIKDNREPISAEIKEALNKEVIQWGLEIKSVELPHVEDPKELAEPFQRAIVAEQEKIVTQTNADAALYKREKEIEAERLERTKEGSAEAANLGALLEVKGMTIDRAMQFRLHDKDNERETDAVKVNPNTKLFIIGGGGGGRGNLIGEVLPIAAAVSAMRDPLPPPAMPPPKPGKDQPKKGAELEAPIDPPVEGGEKKG